MNTIVDQMFFSRWKLNPAQSMAWVGDKTSRFLLAWRNCHKVGFMFDPTKIAAIGGLQHIERVKMKITVDPILFSS